MRKTNYLKVPSIIPITAGKTYFSKSNPKLSRKVVDVSIEEPRPSGPNDTVRVTYEKTNRYGQVETRTIGLRAFADWTGIEVK